MAKPEDNPAKVPTTQESAGEKKVPGIDWVDSTLSGVNLALTAIIQIVGYVPVPYLKQIASVTLIIVNLTQGVRENKQAFRLLVEDLTGLVTAIGRSYVECPDREHWINQDLESNLAALVVTLDEIHEYTREKHARSLTTRVFQNKLDIAKIAEFRSNINMAVARFDIQSHLNINEGLIKVAGNLQRPGKDRGDGAGAKEVTDVQSVESPPTLEVYYQAATGMAKRVGSRERQEKERQEREREEKERREMEASEEEAWRREEEKAEKQPTETRRRAEERQKADAKRKEEREEVRKRAEDAEARRKAKEERIRLEEREERKRAAERKNRSEEKRMLEEHRKAEDLKKFLAQKAAGKRAQPPPRKDSTNTEDEDEGEDEDEFETENSEDEWEDDETPVSTEPESRRPKPKRRTENVNSDRFPKRKAKPATSSYPGHEPQYPPSYSPQPAPFYSQPYGYHTPPNPAASPFGFDMNAMLGSAIAQSVGATVMNIGSGNVAGNTYRNVNNTTTKPRQRHKQYESHSDEDYSDEDYSDEDYSDDDDE